ncbi:hypothetical protein NM208_g831 [Fusarium decemcellulare]|uniref:Uncharacterized protein n=1 Tax=Fusarium decemcellulare TaxID=57161 RepID=A0ACC1SY79_9HYPO|nr:hypothetical protein NM208_g831 [Fusarium decemcellulare]
MTEMVGLGLAPSLSYEQAAFTGFLIDMDGTIIDSTHTIVKHWNAVGEEIGVDPELILATCHGRRSIDVLKVAAPEKGNVNVQMLEARSVEKFKQDVVVIPDARPFLEALSAPSALWAIVTSGTEPGVNGWIKTLNLSNVDGLVTAESVIDGRPDPTCYQIGLRKLGLQDQAAQVPVLEDSPAGIEAGKAAGCKVLAVATTHSMEQIVAAGPDWIVKDLGSIKVVDEVEGRIIVEISDVLGRG